MTFNKTKRKSDLGAPFSLRTTEVLYIWAFIEILAHPALTCMLCVKSLKSPFPHFYRYFELQNCWCDLHDFYTLHCCYLIRLFAQMSSGTSDSNDTVYISIYNIYKLIFYSDWAKCFIFTQHQKYETTTCFI